MENEFFHAVKIRNQVINIMNGLWRNGEYVLGLDTIDESNSSLNKQNRKFAIQPKNAWFTVSQVPERILKNITV